MSVPESHTISVEVRLVGETRTGAWCDSCALPSVLVQDFEILRVGDPILATGFSCTNCETGRFMYR